MPSINDQMARDKVGQLGFRYGMQLAMLENTEFPNNEGPTVLVLIRTEAEKKGKALETWPNGYFRRDGANSQKANEVKCMLTSYPSISEHARELIIEIYTAEIFREYLRSKRPEMHDIFDGRSKRGYASTIDFVSAV